MASRITIKNEFTGSTTTVDPSKPLTRQKIRAIRRRLCRPECTSGDLLGARGPQADAEAYERFYDRALHVFSLPIQDRYTVRVLGHSYRSTAESLEEAIADARDIGNYVASGKVTIYDNFADKTVEFTS